MVERVEKILRMRDAPFKHIIGTTKPVFQEMIALVEVACEKLHEFGGKPPKLTPADKLLITLQCYREYRTMEHLAVDLGCSKSSVCRSVTWTEETLAADGRFQLPGKQALQEDQVKTVAIDVTEHPIERPKKTGGVVFRQEKAAYRQVADHRG